MVEVTLKIVGSGKVGTDRLGVATLPSTPFNIPDGSSITFLAIPNDGWAFQKFVDVWPGGGYETTNNPMTDNFSLNDVITAYFIPVSSPPPQPQPQENGIGKLFMVIGGSLILEEILKK